MRSIILSLSIALVLTACGGGGGGGGGDEGSGWIRVVNNSACDFVCGTVSVDNGTPGPCEGTWAVGSGSEITVLMDAGHTYDIVVEDAGAVCIVDLVDLFVGTDQTTTVVIP